MKITALETIRPAIQPNLLFVRLHTDAGLVGLGEAFFGARTVEAYLHESVAPVLLGMTDPTPERAARALATYVGFQGAGAETRGNGAIDIALWDLLGHASGLPLVDLLGGAVHDTIGIYNTCAGPGYVGSSTRQESGNWGVSAADRYEDLHAFLNEPARLARELWDEGIRGMKIWPFDTAAERTGGTDISPAEMDKALSTVAAVRDEVGMDMKLMIELHGLWNRPAAEKIISALAPYRPYWVEDPLRSDAADAFGKLARVDGVPIATGETCVGRRGFKPLLDSGGVDILTLDVQWTGGLTEARKVASMADAYGVPVAPHDCTGPATLASCVHFVCSQPNGLIQETVRAFLRTWYDELVTGLPEIQDGQVRPGRAPGHGVTLRDGVAERDDVERRVSRL
ncbi:mandelate racemase/muconate lactonizing enzyme family protein [Microtetraspora sp. NBRC 16547]|uniref:mandelate racemase/muconate lactonizing enzyme family protein n=1 Tax=Microtetraspora sp. NBRC 16547 TaxID=3030993 RepID=UPI0024A0CC0B|nr:mandelate racemase/muconate lactonizing enzyme family protein [Microtetraspora sp. NBRC 16547]GLW98972.1 mandelate racemase [Microtetraspora sp. NBRC 16547]